MSGPPSRGTLPSSFNSAAELYRIGPRAEIGWLTVLGLVTVVTRLYHFWEAPYLGFVDIGGHASSTLNLMKSWAPPWHLGWGNVPSFYWYTLVPFFAVFDPPILAQKVAVISFSIISLALGYMFLRGIGGNLFALLAIQALVFSRLFLFYSRYPMEPMDVFMFFVAALLFFRLGMYATGRLRATVLLAISALMLAAAQHIYLSARLLVPVFGLYSLILCFRRRHHASTLWRVAAFALFFAAFTAPLAYEYYTHQTALFARQNEIGVVNRWDIAKIATNYYYAFLSFVTRGDQMAHQNVPGVCMINRGLAALFLIGIALGVGLIRYEAVQLAFAVYASCLLASALTTEPWNSKRSFNAILGVAIFAAFPASYFMNRWGRRTAMAWLVPALVTSITVAFGVGDFRFHFVDLVNNPASVEGSGYHQTTYASEVADAGRTNAIVISSARRSPQSASFHPHIQCTAYDNVMHVPWGDPTDRDMTFLLEPKDEHWLPILRWFYPEATATKREFRHGRRLMRYDLRAQEINAALGVQIEQWRPGDSVPARSAVLRWSEPTLTIELDHQAERARLHGLVYVQPRFAVGLDGDGLVDWAIEGDPLPPQRVHGPTTLSATPGPKGWLSWEVTFHPEPGATRLMLSKQAQPLKFVAKDAPQDGVRQIEFSDPSARALAAISFVPHPFFYNNWGRFPSSLTAFCGEVVIANSAPYVIAFTSPAGGRVRVDGVLDEEVSPSTRFTRTAELQPGVYSYLYAVNYGGSRGNPPEVNFDIAPGTGALTAPTSLQWRPCQRSLSAMHTAVQGMLSPPAAADH